MATGDQANTSEQDSVAGLDHASHMHDVMNEAADQLLCEM